MKRLAFFATAIVGLAVGIAACADAPAQPLVDATVVSETDASFGGGSGGKAGRAPRCEDFLSGDICREFARFPDRLRQLCRLGVGESLTFDFMLGKLRGTVQLTRTTGGITGTITITRRPGASIVIPIELTARELEKLCTTKPDKDKCPDDDDDDDSDSDSDSD